MPLIGWQSLSKWIKIEFYWMCILLLLSFNWIDTLNKWGALIQEFLGYLNHKCPFSIADGSMNETEKDKLLPSASQKL